MKRIALVLLFFFPMILTAQISRVDWYRQTGKDTAYILTNYGIRTKFVTFLDGSKFTTANLPQSQTLYLSDSLTAKLNRTEFLISRMAGLQDSLNNKQNRGENYSIGAATGSSLTPSGNSGRFGPLDWNPVPHTGWLTPHASTDTISAAYVSATTGFLQPIPPKIGTAMNSAAITDTARFKISSATGGTIKSWSILAPPEANCTITVDRTVRYSGKFGNLFMSRANKMLNATFDNTFLSRYFSVTFTGGPTWTYTFGHNAYFDVPFHDSVNVMIAGTVAWTLYYNIFYEVGRNVTSPYSEFYAYGQDSVLADANANDTLLALSGVGKGVYHSLYYWMLGDSVNGRSYNERDFCVVQDGNSVRLSTGTEDYAGYYYYFHDIPLMASRTTDFHGVPTSGLRSDNKYLDCFYRIHELDQIPFDNNFILYWEQASVAATSRYCHIGYCVIYYLDKVKP